MTNIMAAALALAVALVPSLVDAQPGCRSECGAMFRQCQQSCVGADDADQCISNCRILRQQCLASYGSAGAPAYSERTKCSVFP